MNSIIEKDTYTPYFASQITIVAIFYALFVFCGLMLTKHGYLGFWDAMLNVKGASLISAAVISYLFVVSRVGILVKVIIDNEDWSKKDKATRLLEVCLIMLAAFVTPFYTFGIITTN
ncbi:hypothetical protein I5E97_09020 [Proteus hauseri]|uniref:hypothetical protein n=1 Tax=Proteus sp. G2669 TaxID=2698881 RepID=UPI0014128B37|nr:MULTISPECIES: hypothetical protein [Proteus]MBG6031192.1 hypothetical protein [Proteus hauseri]NBM54602.1 hypothetical protein [Proteus sp. G2669]HEM7578021.1 hypothetical protein [Serratia marcescens]